MDKEDTAQSLTIMEFGAACFRLVEAALHARYEESLYGESVTTRMKTLRGILASGSETSTDVFTERDPLKMAGVPASKLELEPRRPRNSGAQTARASTQRRGSTGQQGGGVGELGTQTYLNAHGQVRPKMACTCQHTHDYRTCTEHLEIAMQRRGISKKELKPTAHPMTHVGVGRHTGDALPSHFDVLRLDHARESATQPRVERNLDKAHSNALSGPFVDPLVIPEMRSFDKAGGPTGLCTHGAGINKWQLKLNALKHGLSWDPREAGMLAFQTANHRHFGKALTSIRILGSPQSVDDYIKHLAKTNHEEQGTDFPPSLTHSPFGCLTVLLSLPFVAAGSEPYTNINSLCPDFAPHKSEPCSRPYHPPSSGRHGVTDTTKPIFNGRFGRTLKALKPSSLLFPFPTMGQSLSRLDPTTTETTPHSHTNPLYCLTLRLTRLCLGWPAGESTWDNQGSGYRGDRESGRMGVGRKEASASCSSGPPSVEHQVCLPRLRSPGPLGAQDSAHGQAVSARGGSLPKPLTLKRPWARN
jgi:hypothetical protein